MWLTYVWVLYVCVPERRRVCVCALVMLLSVWAGVVRAWKYLGGSHRVSKLRFALMLPFSVTLISFGFALYKLSVDSKEVLCACVGTCVACHWLLMVCGGVVGCQCGFPLVVHLCRSHAVT
jgi:hypothetical protein